MKYRNYHNILFIRPIIANLTEIMRFLKGHVCLYRVELSGMVENSATCECNGMGFDYLSSAIEWWHEINAYCY